LLTCGFVGGRIGNEHSNRNSASIWQWDEPNIVRCVRDPIVYIGRARFVSNAHSRRQVSLQAICPRILCHPAQKQLSMFCCQQRMIADPKKQMDGSPWLKPVSVLR
jgi:hypothetical protein